jgi:hypothetical protein
MRIIALFILLAFVVVITVPQAAAAAQTIKKVGVIKNKSGLVKRK